MQGGKEKVVFTGIWNCHTWSNAGHYAFHRPFPPSLSPCKLYTNNS